MSIASIRRVAAFTALSVLALAPSVVRAGKPVPAREDVPLPAVVASQDPAVIELGRYLVYGPARCSQCHGAYDPADPSGHTAEVRLSGGRPHDFGGMGMLWASNLTSDPTTGLGAQSDGEIARAIQNAVLHDGTVGAMMAFDAADLSEDDLVAVVSFLRTLPPVANEVPRDDLNWIGRWGFVAFGGGPDLRPAPAGAPMSEEPDLERGAYLVEHVADCLACHSPMSTRGGWHPTEPFASGGVPSPDELNPAMEHVGPNLTPHPTAGVTGRLDEDAFVARMRAPRQYPSSRMPWENVARMSDADLRSIYRYLRTLPASDADPGPAYRSRKWKPGREPVTASTR
jgi:mono/diheme cytochrome c family protein